MIDGLRRESTFTRAARTTGIGTPAATIDGVYLCGYMERELTLRLLYLRCLTLRSVRTSSLLDWASSLSSRLWTNSLRVWPALWRPESAEHLYPPPLDHTVRTCGPYARTTKRIIAEGQWTSERPSPVAQKTTPPPLAPNTVQREVLHSLHYSGSSALLTADMQQNGAPETAHHACPRLSAPFAHASHMRE